MPQINKGDREVVTVRLPIELFQKLDTYVKRSQTTKTDFVGGLIAEALEPVDLENLDRQQERLPLTA
ncbi:hypothetical protein [Nesterenkonia lutea]|uniref:DNA-binding protein n=1 Tax=Nesterenkonia lutea TaxID=272919 RepID=A0ABR9JHS7_9MICC|nr:hypothetical protein [Nesterenkonia lutea]MBE1525498.1 putative DNA-binding protein [Nesterenkonia lutea]